MSEPGTALTVPALADPFGRTNMANRTKGDDIGYRAAHYRKTARDGPASLRLCIACGTAAAQWAYTGGCPRERVERGQRYSPDPDMYQPMCVPCHRHTDGPLIGEAHWNAKLTRAQVLEIRGSTTAAVELAAKFGVVPSTISAVRHRQNWKVVADKTGAPPDEDDVTKQVDPPPVP